MNGLFRPSILAIVSIALAISAIVLVLWPRAPENRAVPLPVDEGDQKIVWLYAATNAVPWERFVEATGSAVQRLAKNRPDLPLEINASNAFPRETTGVSELALSVKGKKGRLLFRWYKLTSDLKTQDWVTALLRRRPAPLAVLGGSSSDLAIELAHRMAEEVGRQPAGPAPLLLLTTATANDEPSLYSPNDESVPGGPLQAIYPQRTFRFCFTNQQMAEAVTDFIWSQSNLRPESDPVYRAFWEDDPYSRDLCDRFGETLAVAAIHSTARTAARTWAWLTAFAATGGMPIDAGRIFLGHFRNALPLSWNIPYSAGTFDRPNRWELAAARELIDAKLHEYPNQQQPLLIVSAASQPTQRFLRAIVRTAPVEARRFVVATGDAIAFNVVYRDRNITWPIQEFPIPLVFFCHRDPVDASAGFSEVTSSEQDKGNGSSAGGTEDLLLFVDIVEALVQASYREANVAANPDRLRENLQLARWSKEERRVEFSPVGRPLFDSAGNRRSGTGEHVVHLAPVVIGGKVLAKAKIAVWSWQPDQAPGKRWTRQRILDVSYEGALDLDSETHVP